MFSNPVTATMGRALVPDIAGKALVSIKVGNDALIKRVASSITGTTKGILAADGGLDGLGNRRVVQNVKINDCDLTTAAISTNLIETSNVGGNNVVDGNALNNSNASRTSGLVAAFDNSLGLSGVVDLVRNRFSGAKPHATFSFLQTSGAGSIINRDSNIGLPYVAPNTDTFVVATYSSNITLDLANRNHRIVLSGSPAFASPTNRSAGKSGWLEIVQYGTGGYVPSFDTAYVIDRNSISKEANAVILIRYTIGTDLKVYCVRHEFAAKRPPTSSSASFTSPWAFNSTSINQQAVTAHANDLTISADAGTPTDGQMIALRFKGNGSARTLTLTGGASKGFRDQSGKLTASGANFTLTIPAGQLCTLSAHII